MRRKFSHESHELKIAQATEGCASHLKGAQVNSHFAQATEGCASHSPQGIHPPNAIVQSVQISG